MNAHNPWPEKIAFSLSIICALTWITPDQADAPHMLIAHLPTHQEATVMASEDLLKKAVAAFNALSPEQQAEMLEEQRQSWVRGNIGLSRDERGMTSPVTPQPTTVMVSELKPWRYEIKYGPDGEDSYSWVYDDQGVMVAPMRTNKAKEVVDRMNTRPAPAATDMGLVTVGEVSTVRESVAAFAGHMLSRKLKPGDLLCLRSQAEELLAAKDKQIALAETSMLEMHQELNKLEADNAALIHDLNRIKDHETELVNDNVAQAARINGFEGFLDDLAEILGCERDIGDVVNEIDAINNRAEALEAKLEAAEKGLETEKALADRLASALEYIEDYSLCYPDLGIITGVAQPALEAHTEARAALGGKPS